MNKFNRNLSTIAGICIIIIAVSSSIISNYLQEHNLSFNEDLIEGDTLVSNLSLSELSASDFSDNYTTLVKQKSLTFPAIKKLYVNVSLEEIYFIEENRSDIKIDYQRTYPDSPNYQVSFYGQENDGQLSVYATQNSSKRMINLGYEGSLTFHIPKDYHFESITLDSGTSKISNDNITLNTDQLSLLTSLGDIDLDIDSPLEQLYISCQSGSINLDIDSPINTLDAYSDFGGIKLFSSGDGVIDHLYGTENMGDIKLDLSSSVGQLQLHNDLGQIKGHIHEVKQEIIASTEVGLIHLTFQIPLSPVYASTNIGSVDSDFDLVSTPEDAENYQFTSSLGSIHLIQEN